MDKNKREELNRHIKTALAHISQIPVKEVYVDYMSIARQSLLAASNILNKEEETEG